ncbi:MAG: hypothetical protein KIC94_08910 [Clostridiales bacterium]|nr:hypothetical protein [Clostridiales bacterium]
MEDITNLYEEAKKLFEEKKYTLAIKIYIKLYSADMNKWDWWRYAKSLKQVGQLNEAITIASSYYNKDKSFKYMNDTLAWSLYELYFKKLKDNYDYVQINKLYEIAVFICSITNQENFSPNHKTVIKMLKILKNNGNKIDNKVLKLLEKVDVNKLSDEPGKHEDEHGMREYQSEKEMYYSYKTKALYDIESYDRCIDCCNEALSSIKVFHHDIDYWITERKEKSKGELGQIEPAINELNNLLKRKKRWKIFEDIAELYLKLDDKDKALLYFAESAICEGNYKMKVIMLYNMIILMQSLCYKEIALLQANFVRNIRNKEGWDCKQINNFIDSRVCKDCNIEKEVVRSWYDIVYSS